MAQAPTVAIPKRFPLVLEPENRDENTSMDAKLVNCYTEEHRQEEQIQHWIYKRGGNVLYSSIASAPSFTWTSSHGVILWYDVMGTTVLWGGVRGQGVYNWLGDLYSVFAGKLYKNSSLLGSVDNTASYTFSATLGEKPTPTSVSSLKPILILNNGAAMYWYDGTSLQQVANYTPTNPYMIQVGSTYIIESIGSTDWTLLGAPANIIGTRFVATGSGYGTGTVGLAATSMYVGATYAIAGLGIVTQKVPVLWTNNSGSVVTWTPTLWYTTLGPTDFTLYGAGSNTLGTVFTCTKAGHGAGYVHSYNYPAITKPGIVYLDGTIYVGLNDAHIQGTSTATLNSVQYWDPLNSIVAQIEPDNLVCTAKQLVYVIAMKQWTTEVFYDAGNPTGSPLASVPGAKIAYGCAAASSVQSIDDVLYWVTNTRSANLQVIMMEGLKAQIISTKAIEKLLEGATQSGVYSWSLKDEGHIFYGLTAMAANLTLVYDYKDKVWHQWTDIDGDYWPYVGSTFTAGGQHIFQHESNGNLYSYSRNNFSDPDGVIPVLIVTPNFDGGTRRRKMLNCVEFVGDQSAGSVITVSYNDQDFAPTAWSTARTVDMSLQKPALYSNGTFIKRAYRIQHQVATRFRLQAMELQVDVGTL